MSRLRATKGRPVYYNLALSFGAQLRASAAPASFVWSRPPTNTHTYINPSTGTGSSGLAGSTRSDRLSDRSRPRV
ncbi:hypothetical protein [Phaffia rhodozyma]|uniref:Uncharacterized protein n=1 Tax=Phaffia rhodozyma TaxID=264483 RepID=A0A0F7SF80_PHARH|nr:hypothetical protein [Phaffia rhodozyma]